MFTQLVFRVPLCSPCLPCCPLWLPLLLFVCTALPGHVTSPPCVPWSTACGSLVFPCLSPFHSPSLLPHLIFIFLIGLPLNTHCFPWFLLVHFDTLPRYLGVLFLVFHISLLSASPVNYPRSSPCVLLCSVVCAFPCVLCLLALLA